MTSRFLIVFLLSLTSSSVLFGAARQPENPVGATAGLNYQFYTAAIGFGTIPDFTQLTPAKVGVVNTFDLSPRMTPENHSFQYTGFVTVPTTGVYTFYVASDDASRLFIGNTLVVENNFAQFLTEKSGTIDLAAGTHALTVHYAQGGGESGLEVRYSSAGIAKTLVPNSALTHLPLVPRVSQPVIFPTAPGVANTTVTVVLSCATPDSTIYYTLNGQTPTTASTPYVGSFQATLPVTVKALGTAPGFDPSLVVSQSYVSTLPPPNDNFADAIAIAGTLPQSVNGSNTAATRESGEPIHADSNGFNSVWYSWTASASGSIQISTAGAPFDTALAIYTGAAVGALTPVAENDDASLTSKTSLAVFSAVAGTTYYIAVDGFNGAQGTFSLSVAQGPQLSIDAVAGIPAEGGAPLQFQLNRTGSTDAQILVNFELGGTADRGSDYARTDEFVTLGSGVSSLIITLPVTDDYVVDANETVLLTLLPSPAYALDPAKTVASTTILDNDTGSGTVKDVAFSIKRGFYTQPFDLTLSTTTAGASIRYTEDGTMPTPTSGTVYSAPITIFKTSTIRAIAYKAGANPSVVETHTYIFTSDVITQSNNGSAPPGWPSSWGSNNVDYGMDPDIVNTAPWNATIQSDLKTIPSLCLSMKLDDLFGAQGIYSNPQGDGYAWERPCSLELIDPNSAANFGGLCGVRLRGGYSRSTSNPKHAFRIFFRKDYNKGSLSYPLFGLAPAQQKIEKFDIRTFQNYSWSSEGNRSQGCFIRDVFSRDTQLAISGMGTRGEYYHLYINGQYWGLFNTEERPEASFAENYFGGDKDDYDVIKTSRDNNYNIYATDGNMDAWTRLWKQCKAGLSTNAAYYKIQGRNPDGTPNPSYENLLEVDQMIEYMLVMYYTGNLDAPISQFLGNTNPNNIFFSRNRNGNSGFRFFAHDSEHTLLNVNENRLGPFPAGNTLEKSNPQWIFQQCMANEEFRIRVADHIRKHFFGNGLLTPASCIARFSARMNQLDRAVVGESARWGDSRPPPTPATRNDWLNVCNNILNNYFPNRTSIVLDQFRSAQLYPLVTAPEFSQYGGAISAGFVCTITNPNGSAQTYYTIDGTDPRTLGGGIAGSAIGSNALSIPVVMNGTTTLRARILSGSTWSALTQATFTAPQDFTKLKVTEVMYNPPNFNTVDGQEFEFLELKNTGAVALNLSGANFTSGIAFTFPTGFILAPGQFAVLVSNASQFALKYPAVTPDGTYTGRLPDTGATITLKYSTGATILSFTYGDSAPWPIAADGFDFSLVPTDAGSSDDPKNWRASTLAGGSPGTDDPINTLGKILINEALTNTGPSGEYIELFNPGSSSVDIGGWYLSDDPHTPLKFRIPDNTFIAAGGFAIFNETDYNPTPGTDPSFALDSNGEGVYLFAADPATSALKGYAHGFTFGAAESGVSFGRHVISTGAQHFVAQISRTAIATNSGPRVGPVIFNEVMYQPATGGDAYIELLNTSASPTKLFDPANPANTWKISGIDFTFPAGIELQPGALALVCGIDPQVFRAKYTVSAAVQIFGPWTTNLSTTGGHLELQKPGVPDVLTGVPYIVVESLDYASTAPWPLEPAGNGPSLLRLDILNYGNDPANWIKSLSNNGSPGTKDSLFPAAPSGLTATAQSGSLISLTWIDNSSTETSYTLQRSPDGSTQWSSLPVLGSNVVAYQDNGLPPSTTFYYRVFASNSVGNSEYSNVAQATTQNVPLPQSPSGLVVDTVSQSVLSLEWDDASDNESGFHIERSLNGVSGWSIAGQSPANVAAFTDSNLDGSTTYYYRVRAFNASGDSSPSNIGSGTTLTKRQLTARIDAPFLRAEKGKVFIDFDSAGGEKTLAFNVVYDSAVLSNPVVTKGVGAPAAVVLTQGNAPGVVSLTLDWGVAGTFAAGVKILAQVEFDVAPKGAQTSTAVTLAAQGALAVAIDAGNVSLDTRFKSATTTLIPLPPHAPAIVSGPIATVFSAGSTPGTPGVVQNFAHAGDTVVFTVLATDEDGDTMLYAWDFGDGGGGTSASASYSYRSPGAFTVMVSVGDGAATATGSMTFTVLAPVIPDVPLPIQVSKSALGLNFTTNARDSIGFTGLIGVALQTPVLNMPVVVKVGSQPFVFTLGKTGSSKNGQSSFKIGKLKKGLLNSSPATITCRINKVNLADSLKEFGITSVATPKGGVPVSVPCSVQLGGEDYATTLKFMYSTAGGKTGRGKTAQ